MIKRKFTKKLRRILKVSLGALTVSSCMMSVVKAEELEVVRRLRNDGLWDLINSSIYAKKVLYSGLLLDNTVTADVQAAGINSGGYRPNYANDLKKVGLDLKGKTLEACKRLNEYQGWHGIICAMSIGSKTIRFTLLNKYNEKANDYCPTRILSFAPEMSQLFFEHYIDSVQNFKEYGDCYYNDISKSTVVYKYNQKEMITQFGDKVKKVLAREINNGVQDVSGGSSPCPENILFSNRYLFMRFDDCGELLGPVLWYDLGLFDIGLWEKYYGIRPQEHDELNHRDEISNKNEKSDKMNNLTMPVISNFPKKTKTSKVPTIACGLLAVNLLLHNSISV